MRPAEWRQRQLERHTGLRSGWGLAGEPPSVLAGRYLEWEAAITGASAVYWNSSLVHALMGPIELEKEANCTVPRVGRLRSAVRLATGWDAQPADAAASVRLMCLQLPYVRKLCLVVGVPARQAGGRRAGTARSQSAKHPSVSNGHSFSAGGRPGGSRL